MPNPKRRHSKILTSTRRRNDFLSKLPFASVANATTGHAVTKFVRIADITRQSGAKHPAS